MVNKINERKILFKGVGEIIRNKEIPFSNCYSEIILNEVMFSIHISAVPLFDYFKSHGDYMIPLKHPRKVNDFNGLNIEMYCKYQKPVKENDGCYYLKECRFPVYCDVYDDKCIQGCFYKKDFIIMLINEKLKTDFEDIDFVL